MQRQQPLSVPQRILMYRLSEWTGRWSMLAIFVIAILVAVMNVASVATLTMRAALTFAPA